MIICIIVIGFINSKCVYGAANLDFKEFTPINIQKTANGANVEISSSETNGYELDVKMSTKGLNEGYYTAYLYENQSHDWSNYGAMSFHISNDSQSPIRINVNVKKNEETVLSPSDESVVLIKEDNSEMMEKLKPSYGTIELPKSFEGNIYISFSSFRENDSVSQEKTNEFSKVSSWGIIATLSENQEKNFNLSKFTLINKGSNIEKFFDPNDSIKGKNLMQIPAVGQSISDYKIENDNKDVQFKLMNPVDGITISDNGRLIVTSDVEEQKVEICAVLDNTARETMEVQLEKSWTLSAKEVDGTSKSIPNPDEINKLISSNENLILTNNALIEIRICAILIAIAVGSLYWSWNRNNNKLL